MSHPLTKNPQEKKWQKVPRSLCVEGRAQALPLLERIKVIFENIVWQSQQSFFLPGSRLVLSLVPLQTLWRLPAKHWQMVWKMLAQRLHQLCQVLRPKLGAFFSKPLVKPSVSCRAHLAAELGCRGLSAWEIDQEAELAHKGATESCCCNSSRSDSCFVNFTSFTARTCTWCWLRFFMYTILVYVA